MNTSTHEKGGSGEERPSGFRSSSLNTPELQRPDWDIAFQASVVVNCGKSGSLPAEIEPEPALQQRIAPELRKRQKQRHGEQQ